MSDVVTRATAAGRGLQEPVLTWYAAHARALPWRSDDRTPWAVMVSEFMLQQTTVDRVQPVFEAWMRRWPTPIALASETPGEAVRAWGRLGYPRRALRLHATAVACTARHDGQVPSSLDELRALPGVGEYTAAAILAFAFGQRQAVLDTNVRRVHARVLDGVAHERPSATLAERHRALALLPEEPKVSATLSVAVMELGALVCTARTPRCSACPLADHCAWRLSGYPVWDGPPRRGQSYAGTDRQVRGLLLAVLRSSGQPVGLDDLDRAWAEPRQRARALDGLVVDGLVEPLDDGTFQLPSSHGAVAP
ncbi:MAG: A/G-specific adenine glycosylase [Candidatus Nanopelagicales bacterium]